LDQFIKVESGLADVYMGESKQRVKKIGKINPNCAVVVPSGTWHNIINACGCPLKVYSVYAPPKHPIGTIHKTKLDSDLSDG
jgi:mannose-6-phosphate isomerase-like protein (cupin superfamily)